MSDIAIRVENLGKRYRMGQYVGSGAQYRTLRESLTNAVSAPFRRFRHSKSAIRHSQPSRFMWALKDVSFEVKRGEVLGIIGKNGAGKSTLLKILTRITEPTTGRVEMHGRVGSLLEVGTGFHPELTGRENIYLSGAILGMARKEIDRKFDEIVDFSGIEKYIDTPVKRYSSGMRVRLGFAVAAHLEPEILLIDEVLAVGDAQFQKKCLGKMSEVAGEGRTVLFVSHNMGAIQELCSRALLLAEGLVVEDTSVQKVITDYLSVQFDVTAGDVDVSDPSLRRNSLEDSRFHWKRITLMNSAGKATAMLALGEPFELVLQATADSELQNIRLGFAVTSALGVPIFNSFQIDNGLSDRLPAGNMQFRIRVAHNLLTPGLYEISLGANGDGVVDWLPTALQFHISTVGLKNTDVWRSHQGGLIRYPCEWHMEQGSHNAP